MSEPTPDVPPRPAPGVPLRPPAGVDAPSDGTVHKARRALAKTDSHPATVGAAKALRRLVPGGDPLGALYVTERRHSDRLVALIEQSRTEHPSATREVGLAAVSLWQALFVDRRGGYDEDTEITVLFTDMVEFSTWALYAGDDQVLALLREVERVTTDAVKRYGGHIVKSLGDGHMAVFNDATSGILAAHQAETAVTALEVEGYRPALRAGLHSGFPKRVGEDFVGVDVNIAARVAQAAGRNEVLVSGPTLLSVDESRFVKRKKRFRAKGAPKGLAVYAIEPTYED